MNATRLAVAAVFFIALSASAEETAPKSAPTKDLPMKTDVLSSPNSAATWEVSPRLWITKEPEGLRPLHKGGFTISGPLIQGLRPYPRTAERSPIGKVLDLPVIRMLVPQPIPKPSGGGKYFAWGRTRRPWSSYPSGCVPASGFDSVTQGPHNALISISY